MDLNERVERRILTGKPVVK